MGLRLRPRYHSAKGPHTGSGLRPSPDNSENRNNWSVALLGTERSPRSVSPQPLHCTNRDTSGQGMGRTVHNNFGCSLSGLHTVLCQSQGRRDRTAEFACSRETPSVVICKENGMTVLTSQWFRFATPITDCCIRSQAMILTLKLVAADLSAVTAAAALTRDTADSFIGTLP